MRVTHIGHACVLLDVAGARLLIDPGTHAPGWEQLRDLDAVLVTHAHPDHIDHDRLPRLVEANPQAALLTEVGLAQQMSAHGPAVQPLAAGDAVEVGRARVTALGGRHATIHRDIERIGNVGYRVAAAGEPTFFHPGDSYETTPTGVDVLAVPLVAPWGALKEAVEFLRAVAPRIAFPVHDGILNDAGRRTYLRMLTELTRTDVRDLLGAGDVAIEL